MYTMQKWAQNETDVEYKQDQEKNKCKRKQP